MEYSKYLYIKTKNTKDSSSTLLITIPFEKLEFARDHIDIRGKGGLSVLWLEGATFEIELNEIRNLTRHKMIIFNLILNYDIFI